MNLTRLFALSLILFTYSMSAQASLKLCLNQIKSILHSSTTPEQQALSRIKHDQKLEVAIEKWRHRRGHIQKVRTEKNNLLIEEIKFYLRNDKPYEAISLLRGLFEKIEINAVLIKRDLKKLNILTTENAPRAEILKLEEKIRRQGKELAGYPLYTRAHKLLITFANDTSEENFSKTARFVLSRIGLNKIVNARYPEALAGARKPSLKSLRKIFHDHRVGGFTAMLKQDYRLEVWSTYMQFLNELSLFGPTKRIINSIVARIPIEVSWGKFNFLKSVLISDLLKFLLNSKGKLDDFPFATYLASATGNFSDIFNLLESKAVIDPTVLRNISRMIHDDVQGFWSKAKHFAEQNRPDFHKVMLKEEALGKVDGRLNVNLREGSSPRLARYIGSAMLVAMTAPIISGDVLTPNKGIVEENEMSFYEQLLDDITIFFAEIISFYQEIYENIKTR